MEDVLRPIYQERASHAHTLGVLLYEKKKQVSPVTDNFDVILLIVVTEATEPWYVKHYQFGDKTAAMHIVDTQLLQHWIDTSSYRRVIEWISDGKILFDRNEYMAKLRAELEDFPYNKRDLKLAIEFAKLTRNYSEAKALFLSNHSFDAYSKVLSSLHSLGRLSIIEQGYHPEVIVWHQIKRIDPEVHKLYEELIQSDESVEKRVELMLIAIDFSLGKRAKTAAKHLLDVMRTSDEAWSFGDLKVHPAVSLYELDLSTMIDYLITKDLIEVEHAETKGKAIFHRKYRLK
ncbi:nucleotidyltransferase-like protein [Paraliobacillus ryukyuensis]|uniref:nucleotidyltransferase-like protein n=1 Tax=Paraliobacillus ryukyuensis TaxID=200904 RepID=UPI0009A71B98|nr:nucleotidyltransferase-like protein [Paraliobacillus ryukyuensis]